MELLKKFRIQPGEKGQRCRKGKVGKSLEDQNIHGAQAGVCVCEYLVYKPICVGVDRGREKP